MFFLVRKKWLVDELKRYLWTASLYFCVHTDHTDEVTVQSIQFHHTSIVYKITSSFPSAVHLCQCQIEMQTKLKHQI